MSAAWAKEVLSDSGNIPDMSRSGLQAFTPTVAHPSGTASWIVFTLKLFKKSANIDWRIDASITHFPGRSLSTVAIPDTGRTMCVILEALGEHYKASRQPSDSDFNPPAPPTLSSSGWTRLVALYVADRIVIRRRNSRALGL